MSEAISAKDAGPAPLCDCHGEKMRWQKNGKLRAGGIWRCSEMSRAHSRAYYARNRRARVDSATEYRDAHRDKINQRFRDKYDSDPVFRIGGQLVRAARSRARTAARKREQLSALRAEPF